MYQYHDTAVYKTSIPLCAYQCIYKTYPGVHKMEIQMKSRLCLSVCLCHGYYCMDNFVTFVSQYLKFGIDFLQPQSLKHMVQSPKDFLFNQQQNSAN